jgi:hypothetical protein
MTNTPHIQASGLQWPARVAAVIAALGLLAGTTLAVHAASGSAHGPVMHSALPMPAGGCGGC